MSGDKALTLLRNALDKANQKGVFTLMESSNIVNALMNLDGTLRVHEDEVSCLRDEIETLNKDLGEVERGSAT